MTFINVDVKLEAMSKGVRLYEIPKQLGIGLSTFEKLMRSELSEKDRQRILRAINQIASSRPM